MALASPFVDPWHQPIEPVVHPRPRVFRKFLPRQAEGVHQLTEWNLVIDGDLFDLGFELALALQMERLKLLQAHVIEAGINPSAITR